MRHFVLSGAIPLAAAMVILWSLAPTSYAAQCFWQHDPNTPGDWFGPGNWDPSAPQGGDDALIDNGGTAGIAWGSVKVRDIVAGDSLAGSIAQSGGTNVVLVDLYLGHDAGATGTYALSGGSLRSLYQYVGYSGMGSFSQSGGTNGGWVLNNLYLGSSAGASGTYDFSGGLLAPTLLCVGDLGYGSFTQSGGVNAGQLLIVGNSPGGTGAYNLSMGSLGSYVVVVGSLGTGKFAQSDGIHTIHTDLTLGIGDGGIGTYELSGGSLLVSRAQYVGKNVVGAFTQSGGVNTVAGVLSLGDSIGSSGSYSLSGGELSSLDDFVGRSGAGSFAQSGGTNVVRGVLSLGGGTGGIGRYDLVGGSLDVSAGTIVLGGNGVGTFAASGGTVLAGRVIIVRGAVNVGAGGEVTVGSLDLGDDPSSLGTMSFGLGKAASAHISGLPDPNSAATIGPAGDHTLDLQTGAYRPREGDAFCVLTNFGSITGSFDDVTTNITLGQQNDPNGLPMPFFAAGVVSDPNDPTKVALQVTFQGLTAGDANGDHTVDGSDLALIGGAWMKSEQDWATCDFNGDGRVDAGDLALFGGNWMWSLPPAPLGAPLPEPASAGLLLAGGLALIGARRRIHPVG